MEHRSDVLCQLEKSMTRRKRSCTLFLLVVLGLTPGLVACNTMEGAGRDASAAGRAVTDTAKETKQGL